jgi:hypothetical protein
MGSRYELTALSDKRLAAKPLGVTKLRYWSQRSKVRDRLWIAVVDKAILSDDLLKQSFVGGSDCAVPRRVDVGEKPARERHERSLADVDEKRRLTSSPQGPLSRDSDHADRQRVAELLDLRRSEYANYKAVAFERERWSQWRHHAG